MRNLKLHKKLVLEHTAEGHLDQNGVPNGSEPNQPRTQDGLDPVESSPSGYHSFASCVDSDTGTVYTFMPNRNLVSINSQTNKTYETSSFSDSIKSEVIGCEFLLEQQSICFATAGGDLFNYSLFDQKFECVGNVTSGFRALGTSPDQDLVLLVTGHSTLILMHASTFEPLTEQNLCPQEFGEQSPVNVGWGSKTTQFHGSEGKQAAKLQRSKVEGRLEWDDGRPRVTWRDDGQLFAVSTIDPERDYRTIRIWNRDGILQATSEPIDSLSDLIAWRPQSHLIASSQLIKNRTINQIIFLEKNGLQHGKFQLPSKYDSKPIIKLSWSSDGRALAIMTKSDLLVYTVNNYHWYLKQCISFEHISGLISHCDLFWDPIAKLKLHLTQYSPSNEKLKYSQLEWHWAVDRSNDSLVAVIDDNKLLMTPFNILSIPPPMAAYSIVLPSSISMVRFLPFSPHQDFLVICSNGFSSLWNYRTAYEPPSDECAKDIPVKVEMNAVGMKGSRTNVSLPSCYQTGKVDPEMMERLLDAIPISPEKILLVTASGTQAVHNKIFIIPEGRFEIESSESVKLPRPYVNGFCHNQLMFLELEDGSIWTYDGTNSIAPWTPQNLVDINSTMPFKVPQISYHMAYDNELGSLIFLSSDLSLYSNDECLMKGVTSFILLEEYNYLLATTLDNKLHCWHLTSGRKLDQQAISSRPSSLSCQGLSTAIQTGNGDASSGIMRTLGTRSIEIGGLIIASVASEAKLVLQMPRGNLEIIHPRALLIGAVVKIINYQKDYGRAFTLMKRHRININLLYDLNPKQFRGNTRKVIEEISVNNVQDLCIFLTELINEDVTKAMYSGFLDERDVISFSDDRNQMDGCFGAKIENTNEVKKESSKVDVICDLIYDTLTSQFDCEKLIEPLIVSLVKKSTRQIVDALKLIKELKSSKARDAALKYIQFMVSPDELFNEAIGSYDFDIVLMVAQNTQRDPKEYSQLLADFSQIQPLEYRKYKIDMYLRRYRKALEHLSKCHEASGNYFEECLALIEREKLFMEAVNLFKGKSDECKRIWKSYGEYLLDKKYYVEAALAFRKCQSHSNAIKCYQLVGDWNGVMSVALDAGYDDGDLVKLAQTMANNLASSGNHLDASYLHETYANDMESAVRLLINGREWQQASRKLAHIRVARNPCFGTLDDQFKSELKSHGESFLANIKTILSTLTRHLTRLKVVQEERAKRLQNQMIDDLDNDIDNMSDTSSMVSGPVSQGRGDVTSSGSTRSAPRTGSLATRRTSKTTAAKLEKKKYLLKEGSQNEPIALVFAIKELILATEKLQSEAAQLIQCLFQYEIDENLARDCQISFKTLIASVESALKTVWSPPSDEYGTTGVSGNPSTSFVINDPELKIAPKFTKINWCLVLL